MSIDSHHHDHDHGHGHDHDHALPVIEEPLDPASKSLSDALRASFRVLKFIMFLVVVFFLGSGIGNVQQTQRVVRWRLGKQNAILEPGLHFSFPYPIDELITVEMGAKSFKVDAFWLNVAGSDTTQDLSDLSPRDSKLDPATDGALITGDRAIMHLLLSVTYRVTDPVLFVGNIQKKDASEGGQAIDELSLIGPVVRNAAVAAAARATAKVVWKSPDVLASVIHRRAQEALDQLESGITLDSVTAEKSHYPLQVKSEFLGVAAAEARMNELIQGANKQREEILKNAAGTAWQTAYEEIGRLDRLPDGPQRDAAMERIAQILSTQAAGEASRVLNEAKSTRDRIVDDAAARVSEFEALLKQYRLSPELVRQRRLQDMFKTLFAELGVSKWIMPEGNSVLYLNVDPQEIRQREQEILKKKAETRK